jgi:hypothetical protein
MSCVTHLRCELHALDHEEGCFHRRLRVGGGDALVRADDDAGASLLRGFMHGEPRGGAEERRVRAGEEEPALRLVPPVELRQPAADAPTDFVREHAEGCTRRPLPPLRGTLPRFNEDVVEDELLHGRAPAEDCADRDEERLRDRVTAGSDVRKCRGINAKFTREPGARPAALGGDSFHFPH